jgi:hypothetical protein
MRDGDAGRVWQEFAIRRISDLARNMRSLTSVNKGTGSPMTATARAIIKCPVCESHGAMLHHDIRASLVYSCQKCMHEWEIDPAEEPPQADPTVAERPRMPSARTRRPRRL